MLRKTAQNRQSLISRMLENKQSLISRKLENKQSLISRKLENRGFTLVELLVVIAVVAILAAVVVVIINPVELMQRGRDASRLTDMATLTRAINVVLQDSTATNPHCDGVAATCTGFTFQTGAVAASGRVLDGSGWVKVDFASQTVVNMPTLPTDPTNNATYHYTYCGGANNKYEINAKLEASKNSALMTGDGGNENGLYEVGSKLDLISAGGVQGTDTNCGY